MRRLPSVRVFPADANFILFQVKNAGVCFRHLVESGILVRDVSNKHSLKHCLRVTVGRPEENEAFLRALKSYN
jgi:histidinol-phosphate aminotransferase